MQKIFNLLLKLSCLVSLFLTSQLNADLYPENIYLDVAKENLKSLIEIKPETQAPDEINALLNQEKVFYEILYDRIKEQLEPSELAKRNSVFNLLSQQSLKSTQVLDKKTWQDLELLNGPKSDPTFYLASKIDRTYTQMGKATLYCKIANPLVDIQQLEKQQQIIKELVQNETLFEQLDTKLKELAVPENAMLSFWTQDTFLYLLKENDVHLPFLKTLSNKINKNEVTLEINDKISILSDSAQTAIMATAAIAMPLYAIALFTNNKYSESLKNFTEKVGMAGLGVFTAIGLIPYILAWIHENKWTTGSSSLSAGLGGAFLTPNMFNGIQEKIALRRCVQQKLINVATYFNNLKTIIAQVKANSKINSNMQTIESFEVKLSGLLKTSQEIKHLLTLLETKTFKGEVSVLSYTGRVYAAFKLMHEFKNQLIDAMLTIGELDAYMSCAKLYKEFENEKVKFCFPKYISNAQSPSIYAQDTWNPVIDPNLVVANSLAIGQNYNTPQNVIITGPNAGGKSTITKSFIEAIILAQSLGIAPANELIFTPFNKIMTYLNITEDAAEGLSTFRSGARRAQEAQAISDMAKNLGFCLIALDEVFNGTTYKEGQAAAYSLIKRLGQSAHNICIANTHFPLISNLETETGLFKNYKVYVTFDENNKIKRPFKIVPGISDQIVTFKILQEEGFGDDFIEMAQTVVEKL